MVNVLNDSQPISSESIIKSIEQICTSKERNIILIMNPTEANFIKNKKGFLPDNVVIVDMIDVQPGEAYVINDGNLLDIPYYY